MVTLIPGFRTVTTSHFPRLFLIVEHRYARVHSMRDQMDPLSFLSPLHPSSTSNSRCLLLSPTCILVLSRVHSSSEDPFCSFISAAHNLPWARIMHPTPSSNRPFSSRNLPRQLCPGCNLHIWVG